MPTLDYTQKADAPLPPGPPGIHSADSAYVTRGALCVQRVLLRNRFETAFTNLLPCLRLYFIRILRNIRFCFH
jgi:hypothetical protein